MARKIIDDAEPSSGTGEGAFRTVKAGIGQAVVQGAALATGATLQYLPQSRRWRP